MKNVVYYIAIVATLAMLVSCGGAFTESPIPTSTPMPTAILTSTVYPEPPTETPMPTPLPDYRELIHMFDYDETVP